MHPGKCEEGREGGKSGERESQRVIGGGGRGLVSAEQRRETEKVLRTVLDVEPRSE